MVVSVVNQYNWRLKDIGELYLDDLDIYGLEFWYNKALAQDEKIKGLKKNK